MLDRQAGLAALWGFAAVFVAAAVLTKDSNPAELSTISRTKAVQLPALAMPSKVALKAAHSSGSGLAAVPIAPISQVHGQATGIIGAFSLGVAVAATAVASLLRAKQPSSSVESLALAAASGKKAAPKKAAASEDQLLWFPGAVAPEWLTNEYLGDRGFDPLGFGRDPAALARNRVAEIFHGRLAMLAFAGALVPELLGKAPWNEALPPTPDAAVVVTFVLALGVATAPLELWRWNADFGWKKDGARDSNYPGFDPFGLASDDTKLKEIKNGRLAMLAVLGFAVQAATTGVSPLENLASATSSVAMM
jgi:hypothetical protein